MRACAAVLLLVVVLVVVMGLMHARPGPAQQLHDTNIHEHHGSTKHQRLCQQVHHCTAQDRVCERGGRAVWEAGYGQGTCASTAACSTQRRC